MKKYTKPTAVFIALRQKENISYEEIGIDEIYNSSSSSEKDYEYEE